MATEKQIMRHLLKGVSWDEAARSLRCSKATGAKCAAKMEEERIDAERLESMTEAEVSDLFADGRSKRGEEYLEPDYARVCDRLARVPKMTLALQWARYTDCSPGGKRLYGYSGFCRKVGEYARAHDLVARIAHEPGRTMPAGWAGLTASVFDPVTGRRSPAYLFVASFPWSSRACAECFPDMRTRSWIAARVRRPRDEASAEKAVDLCETWVLAPLADERFTSLEELNAEVGRLVDALSARPFSRREGCRDDMATPFWTGLREDQARLPEPCRRHVAERLGGVDRASRRGLLLLSDMGSPRLARASHLDAVWRLTPIWRAASATPAPASMRETSVSRPLGVSLALGCWDMGWPPSLQA